jgi:hypothetical protein
MELTVEWVREHFYDILIGLGALMVLSWLYHHAGRLFSSKAKNKYFCRHCNWEGHVKPKKRRCKSCGSTDLAPSTH